MRLQVVDFGAVRAALERLDALGRAHPELLGDEARRRLEVHLRDDAEADEQDHEQQTAPRALERSEAMARSRKDRT